MFCKHCGMESTTPNVCSWCRHPLTAASSDAGARQPAVSPSVQSRPNPPPPIRRSVPIQLAPDESESNEPEADEKEVTSPWNTSAQAPPSAQPPTYSDVQSPTLDNRVGRQTARPIIGVRGKPTPIRPPGAPPLAGQQQAAPPPFQPQGSPPPPVHRSASAPPPPIVQMSTTTPIQQQTAPPPTGQRSTPPPPIVRGATAAGSGAPAVSPPVQRSTSAPPPPIIRQAPGSTFPPAAVAPRQAAEAPVQQQQGNLPPLASQPPPQSVRMPAPPAPRGPMQRTPAPPGASSHGAAPPNVAQPVYPPVAGRGEQPGAISPIPPRATPGMPPSSIPANTISMPAAQRPGGHARQPLTSETEHEESVGLAHGVSASNRPVIPSVADLHIQAALSSTSGLVQSKYYQGQVVDATSQMMYDSASGRVTSAPPIPGSTGPPIIFHWDEPQDDIGPLLLKFVASFVGILVVCGVTAGFLPDAYVAPLCIATFLGGMLLPVFRLIPWQDEDSDDAIYLLMLLLIFGPAIGIVIYGAICLLRQEANISVIACLVVAFVTRVIMELSAQHGFSMVMLNPPWVAPPSAAAAEQTSSLVSTIFTSWTSLLAMVGWYVANVFHKADE